MRIGIVTCRPLPEPDPDEPLLLEAVRHRGAEAEMIPWTDGPPARGRFDRCVVRSTWDYYRRPDDFADWVERTALATELLNPAGVIRWNLHKGYLLELAGRGVPIVPTSLVRAGTRGDHGRVLGGHGGAGVVVKPAISAASYRTRRFRATEMHGAAAFLDELLADGDALIQPYVESVDTEGERSLMWIAGGLTHAIRKSPRFAGESEGVSGALEVSAEDRAFAGLTLGDFADRLLYARIDVMRNGSGDLLLSELELIEPSLFLLQHPPALDRFADAIVGG